MPINYNFQLLLSIARYRIQPAVYALLLLLLAGLSACDPGLPDIPLDEPRLVIWSTIDPDQPFGAKILRTLPFDTATDSLVSGVTVVVFEDGRALDTLTASDPPEIFRSAKGRRPSPGRLYRMEASAPGFPTLITAEEPALQPFSFTGEILKKDSIGPAYEGGKEIVSTLQFNLISQSPILRFSLRSWFDTGQGERPGGWKASNIYYCDRKLADDDAMSAGSYEVTVCPGTTPAIALLSTGFRREVIDSATFRLHICRISDATYEHRRSLRLLDNAPAATSGNIFQGPTGITYNVRNGYGNLNSQACSEFIITFQ